MCPCIGDQEQPQKADDDTEVRAGPAVLTSEHGIRETLFQFWRCPHDSSLLESQGFSGGRAHCAAFKVHVEKKEPVASRGRTQLVNWKPRGPQGTLLVGG